MAKIEKRVNVDMSLERRFSYTIPPGNSAELWPGLLEIGEVEHLPGGGSTARWLYKLNGALFEGWLKGVDWVAEANPFGTSQADFEIAMIWNYQPEHDLPRIVIDGDHTLWSPC